LLRRKAGGEEEGKNVDQCPIHYPVIPRLDELESECGKDRKIIASTREGSKKGEQREREKERKRRDQTITH
jgi:hypothetical protein